MYIVTGGAGFIGSNLVHELNRNGITEILVVDSLQNPGKFLNLRGARFVDYLDKRQFRKGMADGSLAVPRVDAIFHQGACSNTLEDDGVYMMDNNCEYSKEVLRYAIRVDAPFVYASTAAVYGLGGPGHFSVTPENEKPLNVYGFSKLVFDNYLRHEIAEGRVPITAVGLRYFNVYGPREQHKGRMASAVHHFAKQMKETGKVRLFEGSGEYGPGEQRRDFVFVRDLAKINLFFARLGKTKNIQGIANAGSGRSRSFNEVVHALMLLNGEGSVEYMPFPKDLEGRYQHFTEADLTDLRRLGCDLSFTQLEEGVKEAFADSAC
jgi:ADP-L-glycero-D-manno-heptose 6-epimerase